MSNITDITRGGGMQKGKPPKSMSRKLISAPDWLWEAIAEYRYTHRIPTESEAVRRLIQMGLEAAERDQAKRAARSRSE